MCIYLNQQILLYPQFLYKLHIWHFLGDNIESENTGRALLAPYQKALEDAGVDMRLVTLSGEPVPGLARYLRRHPEVAFLACKDFGYLGRSYLNGTERQNALPVPVVIVASRSEGAEQQVQPAADQNSSASVVA